MTGTHEPKAGGEDDSDKTWNDILEKEWEKAREVLDKFDDRIKDLRQWGFTAFTVLIGAEALLLPTLVTPANISVTSGSGLVPNSKAISPNVRLAVLSATILLLVTMRIVEKSYELFQRAASERALVIERHLDIELTEVISDKYKRGHILGLVTAAYSFFVVSVAGLGLAIIPPDSGLTLWVWIVAGLAIASIVGISFRLGLRYPHGSNDWTIGPLAIRQEEKVQITVTNLAPARKHGSEKGNLKFGINDPVCHIEMEGGGHTSTIWAKTDISIPGQDSRTWLWPEEGKPAPGIYRFTPANRAMLRRKVIVKERSEKPEAEAASRTQ